MATQNMLKLQGDFLSSDLANVSPTPVGGSNQYGSGLPTVPGSAPGLSVPPSGGFGVNTGGPNEPAGIGPYSKDIGGGQRAISPLDPALTTGLFNWLQSQLGQGATPFNLQTLLPTGDLTQGGQLSAGLNPLMQMIMQFYQGKGGGTPGMDTLSQLSKGIDVLPAFGAMKDASQRTIAEQQNQLREQFNFAGGLASSPFGTAMSDYQSQTAKDFNAQLQQMFLQSLPIQESAAQTLTGGATDFSKTLQNLDQQSIDRMLQEFMRTQPEYSPLLNMMFGGATTFPAITANNKTSLLSALVPHLLGGAAGGASAGAAGGSSADIIAAILGGLI